ncbi:MAG TPA: PQQ-binding-like beta-propeller repeat protein [bacterium]|nr:PQQ-binding-like beta-propeller repeat protein [bacterium]HQG44454.1 PQQ-binding-like beta-propeller repeat protein [bacterium]HQI49385.1 PQQ-binding-like beta-propeller repeat protein [bacterium]HQJ65332.1 PQQ-binding-like beta-propeller repeat protein [bacterium]
MLYSILEKRFLRTEISTFLLITLLAGVPGCQKVNTPDEEVNENVLWTFKAASEAYYGSPALSEDENTVYYGTSSGILATPAKDNTLYALSTSNGKTSWKYQLGSKEVRSTPAVGPNGDISVVASERSPSGMDAQRDILYHFSPDGRMLWSFNINPSFRAAVDVGQSAPAVARDGKIYVAAGGLFAINPDGTLKWVRYYPAAEDLRNAPVIGREGTVFFVYHNIPLTALDPSDGHTIWSCELGVNDHVFASPAIAADGALVVATNPGIIYKVSASGELLWSFSTTSIGYNCTLRSSPAIDERGTIYLGTNSGIPASIFLALNSDGTVKWTFTPENLPKDVPSTHFDIYSSPAIGADGTIYFGQEFGRVYALDSMTGAVRSIVNVETGVIWSSPALSRIGTLFINDISGRLYAIKTGSRGLDLLAPWPKFRHNNQNSGEQNSD